jgi:organic hydroperoxide reductase OsmC/OhrA
MAAGTEGALRTDDGRVDLKPPSPGVSSTGANPEQLFCRKLAGLFP